LRQIFIPPASEVLGHDASGNRTTDARWTFGWNDLNQLGSAVDSNPNGATAIAFLYDFQGRMVQKTVSVAGTVKRRTTALYDGWKPVVQIDYNGSNQETARRIYTWGPDVSGSIDGAAGIGGLIEVVEKKPGVTNRCLALNDGMGNVVGLVDEATGDNVATFRSGPFGEVISAYGPRAAACSLHWQTKFYDEDLGLYYFGKRWYDPGTRGFISRDPLREAGGVNLVAYCNNQPLDFVDPTGGQPVRIGSRPTSPVEVLLPGLSGRSDLIPMARETGLYTVYGMANVPAAVLGQPRVQGGLKVIGGAGETVVGGFGVVSTSPTIAGSVFSGMAVLHGLDTTQSGWRQMWNGVPTPSFTAQGITAVTGSPQVGEMIDAGTGIVLSAGSGLLTQGPRVGVAGGRVTQFFNPTRGAFGSDALEALSVSPGQIDRVLDGATGVQTWVAPGAAQDLNWLQRFLTGRPLYRNYVEFDAFPGELANPAGVKGFYAPWQQVIPGQVDLSGRNAVFGTLAPNYGFGAFGLQFGEAAGRDLDLILNQP
jgi:RHS repeat-associated protein